MQSRSVLTHASLYVPDTLPSLGVIRKRKADLNFPFQPLALLGAPIPERLHMGKLRRLISLPTTTPPDSTSDIWASL